MSDDFRNHVAALCAMRGDHPPHFPSLQLHQRVDFRITYPELVRLATLLNSETLARERLLGGDPTSGRVRHELSRQARQYIAGLAVEHLHSRTHIAADSVEFYTNILVHKGVTREGTRFVTLEFIK